MGTDQSRGWNRFTGTARGGVYFGTDNYVALALKAWAPPFGVWNNPDITDYLGYGALGVEYGYDPVIRKWYGGGNINVAFQKGWDADWGRRSVQVTAQWRPAYEGKFLEWWKFTPYIFAAAMDGLRRDAAQLQRRHDGVPHRPFLRRSRRVGRRAQAAQRRRRQPESR